jgi:hypothetical protein
MSQPEPDQPKRRIFDWEAIEQDYRAGLMSLRQIAAAHGLKAEASIRQKAKLLGWTRDLGSKIRAAVDAELVRAESAGRKPATEYEYVQAAAEVRVNISQAQRKRIAHWLAIVDRFTEQFEKLSKETPTSMLDARAVVDIAEKAAGAIAKLTLLERQAYALDEPADDAHSKTNACDELIKRLANISEKA